MAKTGLKHTDRRTSELSDAELVAMALEGKSQAAYFALYTRYHAGLSSHISQFVQDREEVEDICMETFEKAFKQLATYRTDMRFSTWILTIARNSALDHVNREKTRSKRIETSSLDQDDSNASKVVDPSVSPEDEYIMSQCQEKFETSIEGLPELYREIARLCFLDNLGYKEISEKTGVPVNTVKTRVRRAKMILTDAMQEDED